MLAFVMIVNPAFCDKNKEDITVMVKISLKSLTSIRSSPDYLKFINDTDNMHKSNKTHQQN